VPLLLEDPEVEQEGPEAAPEATAEEVLRCWNWGGWPLRPFRPSRRCFRPDYITEPVPNFRPSSRSSIRPFHPVPHPPERLFRWSEQVLP